MAFLYVILILIIIILSIKIKLEIINLKFSSKEKCHLNQEYNIKFKVFIIGRLPIVSFNITKENFKNVKIKEKITKQIQNVNWKEIIKNLKIDKNIFIMMKKIRIQILKINLKIDVGTEDAMTTSFIVPTISTVIATLLRKKIKNPQKHIFIVNPVYINQNLVNIEFSGIFEIKMIHIINMIYVLKKKGKVKNYERTSNRRSYGYSYE